MPFEIMGKSFMHEVQVLKHVTEDIIVIDLIYKQILFFFQFKEMYFSARATATVPSQ
jgi:hypothetical protein